MRPCVCVRVLMSVCVCVCARLYVRVCVLVSVRVFVASQDMTALRRIPSRQLIKECDIFRSLVPVTAIMQRLEGPVTCVNTVRAYHVKEELETDLQH